MGNKLPISIDSQVACWKIGTYSTKIVPIHLAGHLKLLTRLTQNVRNSRICSLYVSSLFTNVPLFETIDYICDFVDHSDPAFDVPTSALKELLLKRMKNTQFIFPIWLSAHENNDNITGFRFFVPYYRCRDYSRKVIITIIKSSELHIIWYGWWTLQPWV